MTRFLELLYCGDRGPMVVFLAIILWVGHKTAGPEAKARQWGRFLAGLGFLAYGAYAWQRWPPRTAEQLLAVGVASLFAAGAVLAFSWITLPIFAFIWDQTVGLVWRKVSLWLTVSRQRLAARRASRLAAKRWPAEEAQRRRAQLEAAANAERIRKEQEGERQRREAAQRQADNALRAGKEAARQHLRGYYRANADALADACPSAMLEAFIAAEMHDGLDVTHLWSTCQKKIAELVTAASVGREHQRKDEERRARRTLRLRKIDADIAICQRQIANLEQSGKLDQFQDEAEALREKIRDLEFQKDQLTLLPEEDMT